MAIEKKEFFNLMHYEYGEAYFGSYKGMRYRLAREPLENVKFVPVDQRGPATLMATVWPEPYSYAKTDKKQRGVPDRTDCAELDAERCFQLPQIGFDQIWLCSFGGKFQLFTFGIQDALLPAQGVHQVTVCSFRAAGRQAAGHHNNFAGGCFLPGQFKEFAKNGIIHGGAGFIELSNALPVPAVDFHVCADSPGNSQETMPKPFTVHQAAELR